MSITHNHYYLNTTITQHVCIRKLAWYPKQQLVEFPSFVLQLQLIVVYCLTQALHHTLFKHFGLPPLASQLTVISLLFFPINLPPPFFILKIKNAYSFGIINVLIYTYIFQYIFDIQFSNYICPSLVQAGRSNGSRDGSHFNWFLAGRVNNRSWCKGSGRTGSAG